MKDTIAEKILEIIEKNSITLDEEQMQVVIKKAEEKYLDKIAAMAVDSIPLVN